MQSTKFIWQQGKLIPWDMAKIHVLSHGLHYGSAVFEGLRFYDTEKGPAIFKLTEHIERFFYSAKQLAMNIPYSKEHLCDAIVKTVAANEISSGYIRPLVYYGYGSMTLVPDPNTPVEVMIACWAWGKYLASNAIELATSQFIRIHPRSTVANAKISGHYVNSILASLAVKNTPYHEALLLDAESYVAEASSANIFIVKDATIITPPTGAILEGITRDIIIQIADHLNLPLIQKKITLDDIYEADEAFLSGTAVEITPIRTVDDRIIGKENVYPITQKIQDFFQIIVQGKQPEFEKSLTYINGASQ